MEMGSQNCVFKSMLEISSCLSDTLTVMISACLTLYAWFPLAEVFLEKLDPPVSLGNKVSQVKQGPVMSTEPHGLHGNSPGQGYGWV